MKGKSLQWLPEKTGVDQDNDNHANNSSDIGNNNINDNNCALSLSFLFSEIENLLIG